MGNHMGNKMDQTLDNEIIENLDFLLSLECLEQESSWDEIENIDLHISMDEDNTL